MCRSIAASFTNGALRRAYLFYDIVGRRFTKNEKMKMNETHIFCPVRDIMKIAQHEVLGMK